MKKYNKKDFKFKKKFEDVKEGEVGYYAVVNEQEIFKLKNIDKVKGTCATYLIYKNVCNKYPGNAHYDLKKYMSRWLFLSDKEKLNKKINYGFLKD